MTQISFMLCTDMFQKCKRRKLARIQIPIPAEPTQSPGNRDLHPHRLVHPAALLSPPLPCSPLLSPPPQLRSRPCGPQPASRRRRRAVAAGGRGLALRLCRIPAAPATGENDAQDGLRGWLVEERPALHTRRPRPRVKRQRERALPTSCAPGCQAFVSAVTPAGLGPACPPASGPRCPGRSSPCSWANAATRVSSLSSCPLGTHQSHSPCREAPAPTARDDPG